MRKQSMHGRSEAVKKLCRFAQAMGWVVSLTRSMHLRFTKPGRTPVIFSGTPGDHRAWLNARAQLRRADAVLEACNA